MTTRWRYDKANRRVATIAPDSAGDGTFVDSTDYDPAGNAISSVTRRTEVKIDMTYNAMNWLTTKQLSAVPYALRPTGFSITAPESPWTVAAYPAFSLPAETHTFTYDTLGRVLTADNADAKVKRSYYPGGLLKTDSLRIQTVARDNWEIHKYGLTNTYDLDGRRTKLAIPNALGVGADTTISFMYDPDLGALSVLEDLQHNMYTFQYNQRAELGNILYPASYNEFLLYDADGRVKKDSIKNDGGVAFPRVPHAFVRSTGYSYDARNKLINSGDAGRFKDTVFAAYSGLGHLKSSLRLQYGCDSCDLQKGKKWEEQETHTLDATGNRTLSGVITQILDTATVSFQGTNYCCDTLRYQPGTGRLMSLSPRERPRVSYEYDRAGNEVFTQAMSSSKTSTERASFYDPDGLLRMVESRSAANDHALKTQTQVYSVDEYRYDALGRRVWLRSQRKCDDNGLSRFESLDCKTSFVRRTIWDGSQEIAEIQSPWSLQTTGIGPYDITTYAQLADSDAVPVNLPVVGTISGLQGDPNPYFGHVVYSGWRDVDQPVSITRVNYAWRMDWYHAASVNPVQVRAPFTITPFWNAFGDAPQGVMSGGALTLCGQPSQRVNCVGIQWPWDVSASNRQRNLTRGSWHGTLLESKRDKSGLGYKRNRYYDPATGRFTQEDPIGLAGGMNLYGFAAGDPINFDDPFGLEADSLKIVGKKLQAAIEALRKANAKADETFSKLEKSKQWFVILDSDEGNCDICHYGAGLSFDTHWERQMREVPAMADFLKANYPEARGFSYVNPSHRQTRADGMANVAWHEATHLRGIVKTGTMFFEQNCPAEAKGVPNWGGC